MTPQEIVALCDVHTSTITDLAGRGLLSGSTAGFALSELADHRQKALGGVLSALLSTPESAAVLAHLVDTPDDAPALADTVAALVSDRAATPAPTPSPRTTAAKA